MTQPHLMEEKSNREEPSNEPEAIMIPEQTSQAEPAPGMQAARATPPAFRFLLLAAGVVTAAFGFVALLGWFLKWPLLASFGATLIPMAPSAAVLFLLLGIAIGARARMPLGRRAHGVGVATGGLVAMGALLFLTLGCLGIHWDVEHLGLKADTMVDGTVMGHMSPVSAFCFLLASVSFLASLSRSAPRPWRVALASGAAGGLLVGVFIFLLAYCFGAPLLYGGAFIPPALNTIIAFIVSGLALIVLARWPSGLLRRSPGDRSRTASDLVLIFIFLAAVIVTVGYVYYRTLERNFRDAVEAQLSAVADLKVRELVRWRQERLDDSAFFLKNAPFALLVRRFFEQPEDADTQRQLRSWIGVYETHPRYDEVRLLDAQGVTRLSLPAELPALSAAVAKDVPAVLRSGRVTLVDFYRSDDDRRIHLGVMVPLFDGRATDRPLGVLFLRIDPDVYFYPFVKLWPSSSQTAETLLVRREGDDALFLNELRFQKNTALNLRVPLSRVTRPAAQAAAGREGFMDGVDYRGQSVVAALRTIPDSPWSLVARMDTAEVYAPLREQLWQVVVMMGVLIFGAGAGLAAVWRQQRVLFYREKAAAAEAIRETKEYLENLLNHANAPIIVWDSEGRITRFNHAFEEIAGRKAEQVLGKGLDCLFADDQQERAMKIVRRAGAGERFALVEVPIRHTDGAQRTVLWNSAPIFGLDGRTQVATIAQGQDITERKRAATALQEKNAELERFLYSASHDLKSPVVTVRTFLGYLEKDMAAADAGRIGKDLHFLRAAADKMSRLLDDLLEISRVGRVVAPPVEITFQHLAAEAIAVVAGRIAARGVMVKVGEHDLTLCGDHLRLAEIWQNLVENACKFMGDQPQPLVELGAEVRDGETVFYVRDNGIGLDPRHHAKIFSLFEKLDPKVEGTGIGLSMVKRIVELYHGRVWVESSGANQGSCFYFTLPGAANPTNK